MQLIDFYVHFHSQGIKACSCRKRRTSFSCIPTCTRNSHHWWSGFANAVFWCVVGIAIWRALRAHSNLLPFAYNEAGDACFRPIPGIITLIPSCFHWVTFHAECPRARACMCVYARASRQPHQDAIHTKHTSSGCHKSRSCQQTTRERATETIHIPSRQCTVTTHYLYYVRYVHDAKCYNFCIYMNLNDKDS